MTRKSNSLAALFAVTFACCAQTLAAQVIPSKTTIGKDSVEVVAGADYAAGGFHRRMLGDNYRDLWTAKIKVPVLDLRTFAGGITPFKEGGGKQAKNLRFTTKDSVEYVFRQVHKTSLVLSDQYKGTVIWWIFRDQGSASHPTSAAAAAPLVDAVGVLHANPVLVVMPDDPILGQWQKEFGGVLGWIEEYPSVPKDGPAFFGAAEILESEELLEKMNKDPDTRIDDKTFLRAVLLDMVLGDNDRHPLQWKWIKTDKSKSGPWRPMPRDRDKVFVNYEGTLINLARKFESSLVRFGPTYPEPTALFRNAVEYDRRMLADLDRSEWDAAVRDVQARLTDAVIDNAVAAMPKEYAASSRGIARDVKVRRDHLGEEATRYYLQLWNVADIHGTDAADRATITREPDGTVDVALQSGNDAPYFSRRFNPADTRRIRVYLHDGDDQALVTGAGPSSSIAVRVIGGNGNNSLADQSTVAGHRNPSDLYDQGPTSGVKYARDTVAEKHDEDLAINTYFNRRPWVKAYGTLVPPIRDHGESMTPVASLKTGHGLGLITRVGLVHKSYGFRRVPYESMWRAEVAYATTNRFEVALEGDKRFESTSFHIPAEAKATQLEVVEFHGFGNDVPRSKSDFFKVKQTQYSFRPALGLSLNPESEISIGPVVRYTTTDSAENRFISEERPYGFPHFGQAGVQLSFKYDTRVYPDTLKPRAVLEFDGSAYPAMWDVESAYESVAGVVSTFWTIPIPKKPVVALRGGGKKLYGDFPYFDAAFLGGSHNLRAENRQRFAGDASLYGSAELRVPVAQFPLIVPLDVGVLGFFDAGKVYVDGESPGGWHKTKGAGLWIGFLDPGKSINILFTDNDTHHVVTNIGFAF